MDNLPPFPTGPNAPGNPVNFPMGVGSPPPPDAAYQVLTDVPNEPTTPVIVQASPYWEYAISKIIYDKSGLVGQVPAGPVGTPTDVIRTQAPSGRVVVRWVSKRRGAPPLIPSRDMGCANEVYEDGWVSAAVPGHLVGGVQCWQVEGEYRYLLRVPYTEGDVITLGAMPYTNETAGQNQITPAMWSKNIIGPDGTPPAGAPTDTIKY